MNEGAALAPGYVIAIACAVLACLIIVIAIVRAVFKPRVKWTRPRPAPKMMPAPEERVEPTLKAALDGVEAIQEQLRCRLEALKTDLEIERAAVVSNVESLRQLARDRRLPETLFELYEGMRHFSRKSPEAQRHDLEWHGKIGLEDIEVRAPVQEYEGSIIDFRLDGKRFKLNGRVHRYSRTNFLELTLFDAQGNAVLNVRVQADASGRKLTSEAIMAFRPGSWLPDLLACRARMDARAEELSLRTHFRDVEQLKQSFAIDTPLRVTQSAGAT